MPRKPEPPKLHRVFLAAPLTGEALAQYQVMQDELKDLGLSLRFQKADSPHVTLLYMGSITEQQAIRVVQSTSQIVAEHPPFELTLGGTGHFGSKRYPRVLWLGVEESAPLLILQEHIQQELGDLSSDDGNAYHPHVTIAKIQAAKPYLKQQAEIEAIVDRYRFAQTVEEIGLYIEHPETGERQSLLRSFDLFQERSP